VLAAAAFVFLLAVVLNPLRCVRFLHDDFTSRELVRFLGARWETTDNDADSWTVDWADEVRRVRIRAKGNIEFDPTETSILDVAPGGTFEAETWQDGETRYLELRGTEEGITRIWRVDDEPGDVAAIDPWLAGILPEFFRHTGFGAKTRATRILERDGVEGLFAEIDSISSGDVQASYYLAGLGPEGTHPERVARFVNHAADHMESDAALSRFLRRVVARSDFDDDAQIATVQATRRIDSDATKRNLLLQLLDEPHLTDPAFEGMLGTAADISSDHEAGRFLRAAIDVRGAGGVDDPAFRSAAETISSDAEMRRLLQAAVETQELSATGQVTVLEICAGMFSDTEKRRVLVEFAETYPVEGPVRDPFFAAVQTVGSDHEMGRVLAALLDSEELERTTLASSMDVAGKGLSSDAELSSFLRTVASSYPLDEPLRASYRGAMETLSSEHEKERAQAALDRNPPP